MNTTNTTNNDWLEQNKKVLDRAKRENLLPSVIKMFETAPDASDILATIAKTGGPSGNPVAKEAAYEQLRIIFNSLVEKYCWKYNRAKWLESDDLHAASELAFCEAVNAYDQKAGGHFYEMLCVNLDHSLLNAARTSESFILSRYYYKQRIFWRREQEELAQGRKSSYLTKIKKQARAAIEKREAGYTFSLQRLRVDDYDGYEWQMQQPTYDLLPSNRKDMSVLESIGSDIDMDEILRKDVLNRVKREIMEAGLSETEIRVLELKFGLFYFDPMTYTQIGEYLNLNVDKAWRTLQKALGKLKKDKNLQLLYKALAA